MEATKNEQASDAQVVQAFQSLRQELHTISSKINELENDKNEHELVLDAIKDLAPERKCFRLIGGALVERTVAEVLPAVQKNRDGLSLVIDKLSGQCDEKKSRLSELQSKYKIRVNGEGAALNHAEQYKAQHSPNLNNQGVLA